MTLAPPYCSPQHVPQTLAQQGYAAISPQGVALQAPCSPEALAALCAAWDDLPPDTYLKDGGKYRRRRHSCFVVEGGQVRLSPHRAHWQPLAYNALHGGMQRWFEPVLAVHPGQPGLAGAAALAGAGGRRAARAAALVRRGAPVPHRHHRWHRSAHARGRPPRWRRFRRGVPGRPPAAIKGGETRVFDAAGPGGVRFTLSEPWSLLLLDDARVIHETTPIQPLEAGGHRDTLVLTLRAGGFQGDSVPT
jgi:hypothetical protein